MRIGMIGMGRIGAGMARRLLRAGFGVVAYDVVPIAAAEVAGDGAVVAATLGDLVAALDRPRAVWMMLPAAVVDDVIEVVARILAPGDVIVDGGNSFHGDDLRRARALEASGLSYLDVGVSGGIWGAEQGYCLMIGGRAEVVGRLLPVFAALAPGVAASARGEGSERGRRPPELGFLHCGPSGAGHFVKMVHNAIEYGLMASFAEGLDILRHADAGERPRGLDAETAPLRDPALYRYDFDLAEIAELWRHGSVIRSWLLDLAALALSADPDLAAFSGRVADSGEARWALRAALDEGVPAPALSAALFERFASRGEQAFADKVVSAMRRAFGGHLEEPS